MNASRDTNYSSDRGGQSQGRGGRGGHIRGRGRGGRGGRGRRGGRGGRSGSFAINPEGKRVLYTCILLEFTDYQMSQIKEKLVMALEMTEKDDEFERTGTMGPTFHLTLVFKPTQDTVDNFQKFLGCVIDLTLTTLVIQKTTGLSAFVVECDLPEGLYVATDTPHVTVRHTPEAKPVKSVDLIREFKEKTTEKLDDQCIEVSEFNFTCSGTISWVTQ